ncbi:hypothetical protein M0G43_09275 [Subsaxibacter sp. CAU 1640]|uniref:hypothetical protein n=1 Tax=Subsaxibacter sp. CAU 1640 TaxID=2933271 RepID=UPI002004020D|nr:hypothetical protein [Subsaxibacter sp. CAU 1640]MCK7590764.1 hypothetical protein [Subsaxibacter sp. CAU 1640]
MKTLKIFLPLLLVCLIFNCKSDKKELPTEQHEEKATITDLPISIITRSMEFQMADTIPSGWNTFEYDNRASETHFFRFVKLPEGITLENYKNEADPVFEEGMDLINEGKVEEGFAALGKMPKWFSECIPSGGSGLIAPKHSTQTALFLEPGLYAMECYVKMPNGKFHSTMGMVKEVRVSEKDSGNEPPESTDVIDIKEDGFHFDRNIATGKHVFEVNVINQKLHENYATSDVHLAKISDRADLKALEAWMVWYDPKGFITPVPDGITFLGGFNDATEGSKGYFSVDLKPGKYVLISEVPNAKEKGLMHEFEVLE